MGANNKSTKGAARLEPIKAKSQLASGESPNLIPIGIPRRLSTIGKKERMETMSQLLSPVFCKRVVIKWITVFTA